MRVWVMTSSLVVVLTAPGVCRAQDASSLVVIVKGDATFHQPGCALVAKAGSNVTVAKRGEASRRGLKPHDCGPGAGAGRRPIPTRSRS